MNTVDTYATQIEVINARLDFYPRSIEAVDFNRGYIYGLFENKLITRREKTMLEKVYANPNNTDGRYAIENSQVTDLSKIDKKN